MHVAYTPGKKKGISERSCQPRCAWEVPARPSQQQLVDDDQRCGWLAGGAVSFVQRTAEIAKEPEIVDRITPKSSVGCRRITRGDACLNAIQPPNVKVVFEEAVQIIESSGPGKDETEVIDVDASVCAAGFDTSFRAPFSIVGSKSLERREQWAERPEGRLGLAAPDMPNFFRVDRRFVAHWEWKCDGAA